MEGFEGGTAVVVETAELVDGLEGIDSWVLSLAEGSRAWDGLGMVDLDGFYYAIFSKLGDLQEWKLTGQ
jgi:hypothetical protein